MIDSKTAEEDLDILRCPLCPISRVTAKKGKVGIPLWKCGNCGLLFIHPPPTEEELAHIYQEHYYDSWGGEDLEEAVDRQKKANFKKHLDRLKLHLGSGSLLDVGCAKGHFVDLALSGGFDAFGVEISEYSAGLASRRTGAQRIQVGTLEDELFGGKKYHAVTMFDLLEHVPDLQQTILKAFSILHPGGILYIVTPDARALSRHLMGRHWWHFKREHLYYFNRKNLAGFLTQQGFAVLGAGSSPKTLSLDYIFRQLITYPVPLITPAARFLYGILPPLLAQTRLTLPSGEFYLMCRREAG